MRLTLRRIYKGKDYTIGRMFVEDNGQMVYFCDSLEPPDRGLKKTMSEAAIRKVKLAGKTAIPRGTYAITLKIQSPKFRTRYWAKFCDGYLPTILGIPGFSRVLIHVGTTVADTDACVLCGRNRVVGKVLDSAVTLKGLYKHLKDADDRGENLSITIE